MFNKEGAQQFFNLNWGGGGGGWGGGGGGEVEQGDYSSKFKALLQVLMYDATTWI
jgi:hypothetical protein